MAKALPLILVGLLIAFGGAKELVDWLRRRSRVRRVTAVVVGLHNPAMVNPGQRGRAAVFRFTTEDGRAVDAVSSAATFPEPKVGQHVPVTYDPVDPQGTAERDGVRNFKIFFAPLLIIFGLGLGVFGLTFL